MQFSVVEEKAHIIIQKLKPRYGSKCHFKMTHLRKLLFYVYPQNSNDPEFVTYTFNLIKREL